MTILQPEGSEIQIPEERDFSLSCRAEKLCDISPASCLLADCVLSRRQSGRELQFVTNFRLVPRSRISGSAPLFPPYALLARTRKKIFLFGHLRSSEWRWLIVTDVSGWPIDHISKGRAFQFILLETLHQSVPKAFTSTPCTASNRLFYLTL
jgi:hypothetical protein